MSERPGGRGLLHGYGPVVALAAALTLLVGVVSPPAREQTVVHDVASVPEGVRTIEGAGGVTAPGVPAPAELAAPAAGSATTVTVPGAAGSSVVTHSGSLGRAPGRVSACGGDRLQVPGDPYSPPCVLFSGDNGGATSAGVARDTITVALRVTSEDVSSTLAKITQEDVIDTPEDTVRTMEGLADYFNKHFQLYGRRIRIAPYKAQGNFLREVFGAGQEQANADAIRVASEIHAFADLTAFTEPYADALTRQHVMAFGSLHMSRQWFLNRRPYGWSTFTDCSTLARNGAEYMNRRLLGRPARFAGGSLQRRTRKVGIIVPDNPVYQECLQDFTDTLRAAGNDAAVFPYTVDLTSLSNQAASIISKLKAGGVTTVAVMCDPILLVYLTAKAHEQEYVPEWVTQGVAFSDEDNVAQMYDQSEWSHAFGISSLGDQPPERASFGYAAYRSVRTDEPSHLVGLYYFQLYQLVLGLQLAGPSLTPMNFERGIFTYAGGSGEDGLWGFGPGRYTPTQDFKEVWWDPHRTSRTNGRSGAYVSADVRYRIGHIPAGEPTPMH